MDRSIEVALPADARPSPSELDELRQALQAFVSMHFQARERSALALKSLQKEGWKVELNPTWLAVGRRERSREQAVGSTPDEAIARLYEDLKHETGFGCP